MSDGGPGTGFEMRYSGLSERLAGDDSPGWAVHEQALARRAAGETIYLLSVGDPDLPTLPSTIRAAVDSLEKGRTHYAPGRGEPGLRRVIAAIEERASGKPCDPDEVVVFPGATNAIFTVLSCLLDPGDELLVTEPMYVGYRSMFRALDLHCRTVPLAAADNFRLDPERLLAALSPATRVLFLNTPGNPAGNVIPADTLSLLARRCREQGTWVVCDEVYSMLTFEQPHVSLRRAAAELDNVVIVDGLSKSHAMTGWRLGWTVAARPVSDRFLAYTSSTIFGCCQFVQDAAAFALSNDREYIDGVREEYRQRRNYVGERIAAIPGLDCHLPQAGMFVMVRVHGLGMDGQAFAAELLHERGVSTLPGAGFGDGTAGYVRLSLAQPVNVLRPALDRVAAFCRARGDAG